MADAERDEFGAGLLHSLPTTEVNHPCADRDTEPGGYGDVVASAWLAAHPRFHMHFTPTGSSWINQVERWFGFLTDQIIRRGVHKSVAALEKDIREWIKTWNENPKPFVWRKTAEEILDSLARYCQRISDAGQ
jgi:hypothetical protein